MLTLAVAVNLPRINPAMLSVRLKHCRKRASSTNMSRCSFRLKWLVFIWNLRNNEKPSFLINFMRFIGFRILQNISLHFSTLIVKSVKISREIKMWESIWSPYVRRRIKKLSRAINIHRTRNSLDFIIFSRNTSRFLYSTANVARSNNGVW